MSQMSVVGDADLITAVAHVLSTYLHFPYRLIWIYSCSPKKAPKVVYILKICSVYYILTGNAVYALKYINLTVTLKRHCQSNAWNIM